MSDDIKAAQPQAEPIGEIVGTEKRGFALQTIVRWEPGFNRTAVGTKLYAARQPQAEPVAFVPVHPRGGPLWAMTTDAPNAERLPASYPLMPLYAAAQPQSAAEELVVFDGPDAFRSVDDAQRKLDSDIAAAGGFSRWRVVELARDLNRYFVSGNSVPVEKATIPAGEWRTLHRAIMEVGRGNAESAEPSADAAYIESAEFTEEQWNRLKAGLHGSEPAQAVDSLPPLPDAEVQFTDYFVRNYPGPDTIIHDPRWHAPRIFRAARAALASRPAEQSGEALTAGEALAKIQRFVLTWTNGLYDASGAWVDVEELAEAHDSIRAVMAASRATPPGRGIGATTATVECDACPEEPPYRTKDCPLCNFPPPLHTAPGHRATSAEDAEP